MPEYVPDYNDLYNRHQEEQERELRKLPKCEYCGERIMDDFLFDLDGDIICESCLNDYFRKPVDDYIE